MERAEAGETDPLKPVLDLLVDFAAIFVRLLVSWQPVQALCCVGRTSWLCLPVLAGLGGLPCPVELGGGSWLAILCTSCCHLTACRVAMRMSASAYSHPSACQVILLRNAEKSEQEKREQQGRRSNRGMRTTRL